MKSNEKLLELIHTNYPSSCYGYVKQAIEIAEEVHENIKRLNGEPYVNHVLRVTEKLATWKAPPEVLVAGLFHDIQKPKYSNNTSLELIEKFAGENVIRHLKYLSVLGRTGENLDNTVVEGNLSPRLDVERMPGAANVLRDNPIAIVIKIADRLDNAQSLDVLDDVRRLAYAARLLNVFVPLADRLGMRQAVRELEDCAFSILQPHKYNSITEKYSRDKWKENLDAVEIELKEIFASNEYFKEVSKPEIFWSPISKLSLHRKELELRKQIIDISLASPIVVKTESLQDCYYAVGVIHETWKPIPFSFRDYIAMPKPNGYRGLHSYVRNSNNDAILVIIRDDLMQMVGEYGIASTWFGVPVKYLPNDYSRWASPQKGQIKVFTPDTDWVDLVEGSTILDFAYAIHPDIGNKCQGGMQNDQIVPIDAVLKDGDVVKIITSDDIPGPSPDWLDIVKTAKARQAINNWIKLNSPEKNIITGLNIIEQKLQQVGISIEKDEYIHIYNEVAKQNEFNSTRDLFAAVGFGEIDSNKLVRQIQGLLGKVVPKSTSTLSENYLDGPIWLSRVVVELLGFDRVGLVSDVGKVTKEAGISLGGFYAKQIGNHDAEIRLSIGTISQKRLKHLCYCLEDIQDIHTVTYKVLTSDDSSKAFIEMHNKTFDNPHHLSPVTGKDFHGRQFELNTLLKKLAPQSHYNEGVLLWGPRRIGKTSLLLEFERKYLGSDDIKPVFIDMQAMGELAVEEFLFRIMKRVCDTLEDPSIGVPRLSAFMKNPLMNFQSFIEKGVLQYEKPTVIMFDEFQLFSTLRNEKIRLSSLFRYIRHLLQMNEKINFVFCGGGILKRLLEHESLIPIVEIMSDLKISCLSEDEAYKMVEDPINLIFYDKSVVEKIISLTGSHPYFIRLICRDLIAFADQAKSREVNLKHVAKMLDRIPLYQEQHFSHLWGHGIGFQNDEISNFKLVMTALASCPKDTPGLTISNIMDSGVKDALSEIELIHTIDDLVEMESVTYDTKNKKYRVKLPVADLWINKNYSVEKVLLERLK